MDKWRLRQGKKMVVKTESLVLHGSSVSKRERGFLLSREKVDLVAFAARCPRMKRELRLSFSMPCEIIFALASVLVIVHA